MKSNTSNDEPITWTIQEYTHADRGPGWYVVFTLIVAGFLALDILLLRTWTLSALIIVMAAALIIYVRRQPRTLTYTLDPKEGLRVGDQLYGFDQFKHFGLLRDGEHNSITLVFHKRFSPGLTMFFPEEAGERIVDILGHRLPMETLKPDAVDIIVRKMRL